MSFLPALFFAATLVSRADAHLVAWSKGMFCKNVCTTPALEVAFTDDTTGPQQYRQPQRGIRHPAAAESHLQRLVHARPVPQLPAAVRRVPQRVRSFISREFRIS